MLQSSCEGQGDDRWIAQNATSDSIGELQNALKELTLIHGRVSNGVHNTCVQQTRIDLSNNAGSVVVEILVEMKEMEKRQCSASRKDKRRSRVDVLTSIEQINVAPWFFSRQERHGSWHQLTIGELSENWCFR